MKKESLKLQAYNMIKEKIISCEFAPGTLLNEEVLREDIGASRTPIRDALSRLEQEGLITIIPKKGIMVSGLSIADINMIFEVRLLLEPYTIRNYGATIPDETLMRFYNELSIPHEAYSNLDFFAIDDEFHNAIVSAMPNRFLRGTYEQILTHNRRFRVMTGQVSGARLNATMEEHLGIVKACLRKDWESAAEAMRAHLIASKNSTFDLLLNTAERI